MSGKAMNIVKRFSLDKRGVTGVLFSVSLVPMIGLLAVAVDYSNASRTRQQLQQAVDSTATALAKDTDLLLLTPAQLNARASTYAQSVSGGLNISGMTVDASADANDVRVVAAGNVPLTFAGVLGQSSLAINASVTVERTKIKNYEIALALDNTGSMNGNKITQLKLAVKALATFMADKTKNPGTTKISLVPFARFVRTDTAWMPNSLLASVPTTGWDGCVTDRTQPYDVGDSAPVAGSADTLYPIQANQWVWNGWSWVQQLTQISCGSLSKITPLTDNMDAIKTAADAMVATGNTNVPIGLAWAWHSLSNIEPMTTASPPSTQNLQRVIIALTDGNNTENRWGSNSGGAIDARMAQICSNIKAAGIVLYMVRVIDGNATALQNCATSPTHYYNVTNADQLTPVFEQIATSLSKMRITK